MKKCVSCFFSLFSMVMTWQQSGRFSNEGLVAYSDNNQTITELISTTTRVSKSICAARCLLNLQCNAVEMCVLQSGDQICRLSTGMTKLLGNSNVQSCQRFQLKDSCAEGYIDRVNNKCIYDCRECQCAMDNLESNGVTAQSGIYSIFGADESLQVYCSTSDGYNWTVIQRRFDGSVDFNRNWNDYKNGFGSLEQEFWLGLEYIYRLTSDGPKVLRIDLESFNNEKKYAEYRNFYIENESQNYRLHVSDYSGTAGDSITGGCTFCANGMEFTTFDNDNDLYSGNCGVWSSAGWWHNACQKACLHGRYGNNGYGQGINWITFYPLTVSLKSSEMKIRNQ